MCLAVCGKLKTIDYPMAKIDIKGIEMLTNIQLIEYPAVGDTVLVHAGFAIEKIDKEYYDYLNDVLEKMLEEDDNNE